MAWLPELQILPKRKHKKRIFTCGKGVQYFFPLRVIFFMLHAQHFMSASNHPMIDAAPFGMTNTFLSLRFFYLILVATPINSCDTRKGLQRSGRDYYQITIDPIPYKNITVANAAYPITNREFRALSAGRG